MALGPERLEIEEPRNAGKFPSDVPAAIEEVRLEVNR